MASHVFTGCSRRQVLCPLLIGMDVPNGSGLWKRTPQVARCVAPLGNRLPAPGLCNPHIFVDLRSAGHGPADTGVPCAEEEVTHHSTHPVRPPRLRDGGVGALDVAELRPKLVRRSGLFARRRPFTHPKNDDGAPYAALIPVLQKCGWHPTSASPRSVPGYPFGLIQREKDQGCEETGYLRFIFANIFELSPVGRSGSEDVGRFNAAPVETPVSSRPVILGVIRRAASITSSERRYSTAWDCFR